MLPLGLPEGRYQVRVAAGTAALAGSVICDLEVPDFTQPLSMSGVALTSTRARDVVTVQPKGPVHAALPGPPTASRDFDADETLVWYVEVYESTKARATHLVEMTSQLRGEDGRTLRAIVEERPSVVVQGKTATYSFTPSLPLSDVPPGRYVLHLEARSSAAGAKAVTRDIPFRRVGT